MNEIDLLLKDIEKLRKNLYKIAEKKGSLMDSDVLSASQALNAAISQYNEFIKKKLGE